MSDQEADPMVDRTVLFFHPGGPGVSPVDTLFRDPPDVDFAAVVVATWDGATASTTPGSCGPVSASFATDRDPWNPSDAQEVGEECRTNFGAESEPGVYVASEELEAVRSALRVEKIDLLTHSYGTAIAEVYLQWHPSRVRRAILDGPISLETTWTDRLASVDRTVKEVSALMLERCGEAACSAALQAIVATGGGYEAVREAILSSPPRVGSGSLRLSGTMLDQATLLAMRSERLWADYLKTVDAALSGDGTAVWSIAEQNFFSVDRSVFYSSLCSDLLHPDDIDAYEVAEGESLLATYASELAPCVAIPQRSLSPADNPEGDLPDVLILASKYDVLTPLSLLDHATRLRSLPTCQTTVLGHTSFGDQAVHRLVSAFLADGGAAATAERCARELPPGSEP